MRIAPMIRDEYRTHKEMWLPDGKTCGDCCHIGRCRELFDHIESDEVCDWSPSRFKQIRGGD